MFSGCAQTHTNQASGSQHRRPRAKEGEEVKHGANHCPGSTHACCEGGSLEASCFLCFTAVAACRSLE